jgi:alpha-glucosidase
MDGRRALAVCCGFLLALTVACGGDDDGLEPGPWSVSSPDGRVDVAVARLDLSGVADYPAGQRLYYRVAIDGVEVLQWSPLGIATSAADFTGPLEIAGRGSRYVDVAYETAVGKRLRRRERANELTLRFANSAGDEIEMVFRAAADGAAFRYRMLGEGTATALGEATGFRVADGSDAWLIPHHRPSPFSPAYERFYEKVVAGTTNPDNGWGYAALFRVPDSQLFVLLAEADLDGEYVGTNLGQPLGPLYRVVYPDPGEGNGIGQVEPVSVLPWTTPWRVVIAGDLATVFESTLVDDLSRPLAETFAGDFTWVRPGRSAWSWYSQNTGDPDLQRQYIDFASELGWEYVLVDARWDEWPNGDADARVIVDEAAAEGVGIFLWYNSGGPHNEVLSETPRDRMHVAATRRAELARIADWGVRGVKVDFFQSEKQDRIRQYLEILEDAAAEKLLVNFHGSTLPRGWQRAYPNLVSMEGVLGAEFYRIFEGSDAIHNVRLAFTRNVVGSMDYTPVTFRDALARRGIPYGHQMALAVVFESGVQHFADRADADPDSGFRAVFAQAPFARDFFTEVPTVWDETRLLDGSPDSHVVVARRRGERWWLAAINGLESALHGEVALDFLGAAPHHMRLIRSGEQPDTLALEEQTAPAVLSFALDAKDGVVAVFEPLEPGEGEFRP